MRGLRRRIQQLEQEMGTAHQGIQVLLKYEGVEFALDYNRCARILAEAGFVRSGPGVSVLDFAGVPPGLSEQELRRFLQEHGDQICGPKPRSYSAPTRSGL